MKLAILLPVGPEAQASITAALDRHLAAKRLYARVMPPAQDSDASPQQAGGGNMVDAGQPPVRQTLHYSREAAEEEAEVTHEQVDREADERLADLKRRRPWDFQRDEEDYPQDDGDIQPHERTTRFPWGER